MTITAKYASTCPTCDNQVRPGQQVKWNKGSKARHTDCGANTAALTAARHQPRGGGRTGMGCHECGDAVPTIAGRCADCRGAL